MRDFTLKVCNEKIDLKLIVPRLMCQMQGVKNFWDGNVYKQNAIYLYAVYTKMQPRFWH